MNCIQLVKVHPVVLVSIIDYYEKRKNESDDVVGTLLGTFEKGGVEVTNCFPLLYVESKDEVKMNLELAHKMLEMHKKINPTEIVVGWFSTKVEINNKATLMHEYYQRHTRDPIHLRVDAHLSGQERMRTKCYLASSAGVPGQSVGTMFVPVPVQISAYPAERVALNVLSETTNNHKRRTTITSDLAVIRDNIDRLQQMLESVLRYVDDVLVGFISSGKTEADADTGRQLMELISTVPHIDPVQFRELMNDSFRDLLMVIYLSNLTKTQLVLTEKLNAL